MLGLHPYKCVACDRRFLDRPLARGRDASDRRATDADPGLVETPTAIADHAPALAITTPSTERPARARRRQR